MNRKPVVAGAGVGLGAILVGPAVAQADDYRVTNLNDSGAGSLRAAAESANDNPGADRILFKSKLSGSIDLGDEAIGLLEGSVNVVGPGARRLAVDGPSVGPSFNVFPLNSPTVDATISGLTITGGNSGYGGGISAYAGAPTAGVDLTVSRSTISGNRAGASGGGVYIADLNDDVRSSITVDRSTISQNTAELDGGGIFINGTTDATIRNSTISGNSAEGGPGIRGGGGVWVATQPVAIDNSTIVGNEANFGGGVFSSFADVSFDGSIVADNTAADQGPDVYEDFGLYASFVGDYTLLENPSGAAYSELPGAGNVVGVDPNLKPLNDNGGPTETHAFKKSPAKNKLPKSETPKSDQRGAKRKGKGDIGAYELVKCEGVIVNRVGTAKKDKLKGTKKKDGILGLGGNDKLSGKKGKDGLCGGKGKDKLKGGPGADKLDGGPGKDKEIQ